MTNTLKGATTHIRHAHKCPSCGYVWAHDWSDSLEFLDQPEIMKAEDQRYVDAHKCPQCGEKQYWCHSGDEPIQEVFDGIMHYPPTPDRICPDTASKDEIDRRKMLRLKGDLLAMFLGDDGDAMIDEMIEEVSAIMDR